MTAAKVMTGARAKVSVGSKLVGIFNTVVGCISFGWALLCLIEIPVAFYMAAEERHRGGPAGPSPILMALIFLVMLGLSVATGIVELMAGIRVLKRREGARKLAFFSAIASLCSLWGCCAYPFCLAAGIYTLVILAREDVKQILP